jgi:ATP adenylyltransferase
MSRDAISVGFEVQWSEWNRSTLLCWFPGIEAMEKLWAPWRMAYIEITAPAGCIFCEKPAADRDEENWILHRGELAFVMLNAFPYSNGHLMVAPFRHTADLESLTPEEQAEIFGQTQLCMAVLRTAYHPDGYNIGMNLGKVAGAGVADHLHMHIVPRWNGDTNFMPVIGDTKVLPDSLDHSYRTLREALAKLRNELAGSEKP